MDAGDALDAPRLDLLEQPAAAPHDQIDDDETQDYEAGRAQRGDENLMGVELLIGLRDDPAQQPPEVLGVLAPVAAGRVGVGLSDEYQEPSVAEDATGRRVVDHRDLVGVDADFQDLVVQPRLDAERAFLRRERAVGDQHTADLLSTEVDRKSGRPLIDVGGVGRRRGRLRLGHQGCPCRHDEQGGKEGVAPEGEAHGWPKSSLRRHALA